MQNIIIKNAEFAPSFSKIWGFQIPKNRLNSQVKVKLLFRMQVYFTIKFANRIKVSYL